jgi:hypothetical protein
MLLPNQSSLPVAPGAYNGAPLRLCRYHFRHNVSILSHLDPQIAEKMRVLNYIYQSIFPLVTQLLLRNAMASSAWRHPYSASRSLQSQNVTKQKLGNEKTNVS